MSKVIKTAPGALGPDRSFEALIEGPGRGTIKINGHDVAGAIRGFTCDASIGQPPRVTLDLAVWDNTRIESERTEVLMNSRTHDLLVAAGWTPPAAAEPEQAQADSAVTP